MAFTEANNHGTSNGTTPVTLVAAPASSTIRAVTGFTVYNKDTVSATITVNLTDTGTDRIVYKSALAAGDQLFWGRDDSPIYLNDTNTSLTFFLGGAVTTNELEFTAHYADIT